MMEEKDLISRAARDDADAFRQLVETYQTPAYRLAARMCGPDGAEDVTQEAFLAAWRGLPQFRGDCRFSTWLYRLVNNAAIDYLRREKRHRDTGDVDDLELPDGDPSPQELAEQSDTRGGAPRAGQAVAGASPGAAAALYAGAGLRRDRPGAGRQRGHGEVPHQPRQVEIAGAAGRRELFRRHRRLTNRRT